MEPKYTVSHYWSNPRNNTTRTFDNKREAVVECKKMLSDENTGECSKLFKNGNCIGWHDWHKSNMNWM